MCVVDPSSGCNTDGVGSLSGCNLRRRDGVVRDEPVRDEVGDELFVRDERGDEGVCPASGKALFICVGLVACGFGF